MAEPQPLSAETRELLLNELRDLQLPEPVTWWPPAPGWWIVTALAIGCVAYVAYRLWRRHRRLRYRRDARRAFSSLYDQWQQQRNDRVYLDGAAHVLRQVAMRMLGRETVSKLTGTSWRDTLQSLSSHALSDTTIDALTIDRYRTAATGDIARVHTDLSSWLGKLRPEHHV